MASILIVDDSATDRIRISGLLSKYKAYEVKLAVDGSEALEMLLKENFDLVLTDLQMPDINGLELVREMKEKYPQTPVILMTGVGSEEIAVQAMKDGAASYISKTSGSRWVQENVERVLAARYTEVSDAKLLTQMQLDEYELSLTNDRKLMAATARFLRQVAQSVGVCDTSSVPRLGVALEEALLNACLHGNLGLDSKLREGDGKAFENLARERSGQSPWKDRRVEVSANITPEQLTVDIADEGEGFNLDDLPDPTDPENLLKPHGRGLVMMRLFLDDVQYNERGNRVTLIKKRHVD